MATPATITEFFDQCGWPYEYDPLAGIWRTGFRGEANNFTVGVQLTGSWLYLQIAPFVNAPPHPLCAARMHEHLLRLNQALNLIKFGVDTDGDVVLGVELPSEGLAFSDFLAGLHLLSHAADEHYLDVLNLAHDPDFEPRFGSDDDELADGEEAEDLEEEGGGHGAAGGGPGWELN